MNLYLIFVRIYPAAGVPFFSNAKATTHTRGHSRNAFQKSAGEVRALGENRVFSFSLAIVTQSHTKFSDGPWCSHNVPEKHSICVEFEPSSFIVVDYAKQTNRWSSERTGSCVFDIFHSLIIYTTGGSVVVSSERDQLSHCLSLPLNAT